MALILALETATTVCSVALARDGMPVAFREINAGFTHAENITVFIEEVCREAGVELKQIDACCVSKGPGSYTGLRIGASTAKGLCYALQTPLIAVDTLQAMAACFLQQHQHARQVLLLPMIDARRMEVYCSLYDENLNELKPAQAVVIDENSFAGLFKDQDVIYFGDGAEKCKPVFEKYQRSAFREVSLTARGMSKLAEEKFSRGEFEDVSLFEPFYLKEVAIGKKAES